MSANRGKYAEDKVREFFNEWAKAHSGFCYNRILDAHSARGAMANPQPGDFQWFNLGKGGVASNGLIEVKEVEHDRLLPYKNFGPDQVGRMRIRQMAGSQPLVLVCFRPKNGYTFWRGVPLSYFQVRDKSRGSWDLSEFAEHLKVNILLEEYLRDNT